MSTNDPKPKIVLRRRRNRWKVLREEWMEEEDNISKNTPCNLLPNDSLKEIETNRQYTNDKLL